MELVYDREADALYVRLADRLTCRTVPVDAATLVDLDEHGNVVGVEIIAPAREWDLGAILSSGRFLNDQERYLRDAQAGGFSTPGVQTWSTAALAV